jgi:hypothetical protein
MECEMIDDPQTGTPLAATGGSPLTFSCGEHASGV